MLIPQFVFEQKYTIIFTIQFYRKTKMISKFVKDSLYRCEAMALKCSAKQIYSSISGVKEEVHTPDKNSLKEIIIKGLLRLNKTKRTKSNIEGLLHQGAEKLKLVLKKLDITFKDINFEELKVSQVEIIQEISNWFEANSEKFWLEYEKSKQNQNDLEDLKLLVNHNFICEKISWKLSKKNEEHRENLGKKIEDLKKNTSCSCRKQKTENKQVSQSEENESTNAVEFMNESQIKLQVEVGARVTMEDNEDFCESKFDSRVSKSEGFLVLVGWDCWDFFAEPKQWINPTLLIDQFQLTFPFGSLQ